MILIATWSINAATTQQQEFPEYCIVDPREESIRVLMLGSGEHIDAGARPVAMSCVLPDFAVDVAELFRKATTLKGRRSQRELR